MTSLGEAYGDSRWNGRDPRWISIGAGSFVAGVVAIVLAIGLVATPLGDVLGLTGTFEAREPAGVLAGGHRVATGPSSRSPTARRPNE